MELEITGESEPMSEMPRDAEKNKPRTEEMSASLQKELPKTLIDEDGGAAGAEEAADDMFPRGMGSSTGGSNRGQWTRKSPAAR